MEAIGLLGDVRLRVAFKFRELLRVLGADVEVVMRRLDVDAVELDPGVGLSPREHADDALVEPRFGPKQEAAADGPRRDLDHAHSGRVAGRRQPSLSSAHVCGDVRRRRMCAVASQESDG
jgi:hypothetical protein